MKTPHQTDEYRAYDKARYKKKMEKVSILATQFDRKTHTLLKEKSQEFGLSMQIIVKLLVSQWLDGKISIKINMNNRGENDGI